MSSDPGRRFLFVSCQAGAEPALKDELSREHPELRFAFSRPGFVTFKSPEDLPADFELRAVFARSYGLSLGDSKDPDPEVRAKAAAATATAIAAGKPLRLHVWERDQGESAEREDSEIMPFAPHAELSVRDAAPGLFEPPGNPDSGDLVFDLILIDREHWFFGFHEHTPFHSRDAGGKPVLILPPEAPSRAYLKIQEALRWAALEPQKGERALEIGSAPGGATYALLQRGLDVIGIDPAAMDPAVLVFGRGRFRHLKKGVADVMHADLPEEIHWLLLDMNVPPQIALDALEELWPRLGQGLLGVLLTLKLNRWRIAAEVPEFLTRIRELGLARVAATQLPSNRQEFSVVGLTPRGLDRAGPGPLRP
jgi:23S rRNA (cytidine2498-2'-O)-methyltransferase